MGESRTPTDASTPTAPRERRRAAAIVAQYIHELFASGSEERLA